jgi:hypothetical protein
MALTIEQITDKVDALKERFSSRDQRMSEITAVRRGDMESVYPEMFPEGMSKPMIANFVDVAARDIAEVLAPLPSFNCSTINTNSDKAKRAADKRTIIANHYIEFSDLSTQMYTGADWYLTYGFLPIFVEPDLEARMPRIRVENPMGSYPEFDRYGRCVSFTKRYMKTIRELIVEFPEFEPQILGPLGRRGQDLNAILEMMKYEDKDQIVLFLPQRGNLVLNKAKNPINKMMVSVARRPGIDIDDPRGQFDDVLWAQIARARFSLLAMEAAEKSVQAPMAVPQDVQEFAFGPDAVLRSSTPEKIRRVGLELPTAAFSEQQLLENELRMGSRYPEGRSGQIDASIITGSGVQALLGGFDTQIKAGQQILSQVFQNVISLAFEMDERLFPGKKNLRGIYQGAPYEINYSPEVDIKGEYSIQVRYGLMAGLAPSQALIFSLQALQADLVSKDFVMRELPWSMNVSQERERIDIEKYRASLVNALNALTQAIPQMAAAGQDPSDIVQKIAMMIELRRDGMAVEDAVKQVFQKQEAPPAAQAQAEGASPPTPTPQESQAQATPAAPGGPGGPQGAPSAPPSIQEILARIAG